MGHSKLGGMHGEILSKVFHMTAVCCSKTSPAKAACAIKPLLSDYQLCRQDREMRSPKLHLNGWLRSADAEGPSKHSMGFLLTLVTCIHQGSLLRSNPCAPSCRWTKQTSQCCLLQAVSLKIHCWYIFWWGQRSGLQAEGAGLM